MQEKQGNTIDPWDSFWKSIDEDYFSRPHQNVLDILEYQLAISSTVSDSSCTVFETISKKALYKTSTSGGSGTIIAQSNLRPLMAASTIGYSHPGSFVPNDVQLPTLFLDRSELQNSVCIRLLISPNDASIPFNRTDSDLPSLQPPPPLPSAPTFNTNPFHNHNSNLTNNFSNIFSNLPMSQSIPMSSASMLQQQNSGFSGGYSSTPVADYMASPNDLQDLPQYHPYNNSQPNNLNNNLYHQNNSNSNMSNNNNNINSLTAVTALPVLLTPPSKAVHDENDPHAFPQFEYPSCKTSTLHAILTDNINCSRIGEHHGSFTAPKLTPVCITSRVDTPIITQDEEEEMLNDPVKCAERGEYFYDQFDPQNPLNIRTEFDSEANALLIHLMHVSQRKSVILNNVKQRFQAYSNHKLPSKLAPNNHGHPNFLKWTINEEKLLSLYKKDHTTYLGHPNQRPDGTTTAESNAKADLPVNSPSYANKSNNSNEGGKSKDGKREEDVDAVCTVCRNGDAAEGNEIVFCDRCDLCAHQSCIGLLNLPKDDWFCDICTAINQGAYTERECNILCSLCHQKGQDDTKGFLARVGGGSQWSHYRCMIWFEQIDIGNPCFQNVHNINIEPAKIASRMSNKYCEICRDSQGATINCSALNCSNRFHVPCATKHGLTMDLFESQARGLNEVDGLTTGDIASDLCRQAYCSEHSKELFLTQPLRRLQDKFRMMSSNFQNNYPGAMSNIHLWAKTKSLFISSDPFSQSRRAAQNDPDSAREACMRLIGSSYVRLAIDSRLNLPLFCTVYSPRFSPWAFPKSIPSLPCLYSSFSKVFDLNKSFVELNPKSDLAMKFGWCHTNFSSVITSQSKFHFLPHFRPDASLCIVDDQIDEHLGFLLTGGVDVKFSQILSMHSSSSGQTGMPGRPPKVIVPKINHCALDAFEKWIFNAIPASALLSFQQQQQQQNMKSVACKTCRAIKKQQEEEIERQRLLLIQQQQQQQQLLLAQMRASMVKTPNKRNRRKSFDSANNSEPSFAYDLDSSIDVATAGNNQSSRSRNRNQPPISSRNRGKTPAGPSPLHGGTAINVDEEDLQHQVSSTSKDRRRRAANGGGTGTKGVGNSRRTNNTSRRVGGPAQTKNQFASAKDNFLNREALIASLKCSEEDFCPLCESAGAINVINRFDNVQWPYDWVECGKCETWYHQECSQAIQRYAPSKLQEIVYLCPACTNEPIKDNHFFMYILQNIESDPGFIHFKPKINVGDGDGVEQEDGIINIGNGYEDNKTDFLVNDNNNTMDNFISNLGIETASSGNKNVKSDSKNLLISSASTTAHSKTSSKSSKRQKSKSKVKSNIIDDSPIDIDNTQSQETTQQTIIKDEDDDQVQSFSTNRLGLNQRRQQFPSEPTNVDHLLSPTKQNKKSSNNNNGNLSITQESNSPAHQSTAFTNSPQSSTLNGRSIIIKSNADVKLIPASKKKHHSIDMKEDENIIVRTDIDSQQQLDNGIPVGNNKDDEYVIDDEFIDDGKEKKYKALSLPQIKNSKSPLPTIEKNNSSTPSFIDDTNLIRNTDSHMPYKQNQQKPNIEAVKNSNRNKKINGETSTPVPTKQKHKIETTTSLVTNSNSQNKSSKSNIKKEPLKTDKKQSSIPALFNLVAAKESPSKIPVITPHKTEISPLQNEPKDVSKTSTSSSLVTSKGKKIPVIAGYEELTQKVVAEGADSSPKGIIDSDYNIKNDDNINKNNNKSQINSISGNRGNNNNTADKIAYVHSDNNENNDNNDNSKENNKSKSKETVADLAKKAADEVANSDHTTTVTVEEIREDDEVQIVCQVEDDLEEGEILISNNNENSKLKTKSEKSAKRPRFTQSQKQIALASPDIPSAIAASTNSRASTSSKRKTNPKHVNLPVLLEENAPELATATTTEDTSVEPLSKPPSTKSRNDTSEKKYRKDTITVEAQKAQEKFTIAAFNIKKRSTEGRASRYKDENEDEELENFSGSVDDILKLFPKKIPSNRSQRKLTSTVDALTDNHENRDTPSCEKDIHEPFDSSTVEETSTVEHLGMDIEKE